MATPHACQQIEAITALEIQMKELIGNGQPGRMDRVEEEIKTHSRLLYLGMGGIYMLQFVIMAKLLKFF